MIVDHVINKLLMANSRHTIKITKLSKKSISSSDEDCSSSPSNDNFKDNDNVKGHGNVKTSNKSELKTDHNLQNIENLTDKVKDCDKNNGTNKNCMWEGEHDICAYFNYALKITASAGSLIRGGFVDDTYQKKTCRQDLVTRMDLEVENYLIEKLKKKFPSHFIIGEEMIYNQTVYHKERYAFSHPGNSSSSTGYPSGPDFGPDFETNSGTNSKQNSRPNSRPNSGSNSRPNSQTNSRPNSGPKSKSNSGIKSGTDSESPNTFSPDTSLPNIYPSEMSPSSTVSSLLTDDPTWILDPIDGTLNFIHGFPHACISVALYIKKEPVLGVIYNPFLENFYTARKGRGAFLNGKPINVSAIEKIDEALVILGSGFGGTADKHQVVAENYGKIVPIVHGVRNLGSAVLNIAAVASGGADAYYSFGLHVWDHAAGEILVREAGGVVIDPAGGPFDRMSRRMLCASSMKLAKTMSELLVQYYPPRD